MPLKAVRSQSRRIYLGGIEDTQGTERSNFTNIESDNDSIGKVVSSYSRESNHKARQAYDAVGGSSED